MSELRVYTLPECLINPQPPPADEGQKVLSPLLGLFAPKLIEAGIRGIANALKKAGADDTEQVTGECVNSLYVADDEQALRVNPELGCVLGVWFEVTSGQPNDDDVTSKLKKLGFVPTKATVGGVFEAAVQTVPDATAFFLDTRYFSVRDSIGDRGWRKNDRSYVVTLALTTPGPTAEGVTFALGRINFGQRSGNESVIPQGPPVDRFSRYQSNLMPWAQISARSQAAHQRDVDAGQAAGRHYMPVTLSLTITETADGNKFLVVLGEIVDGLAAKAAEEIGAQILPSERAKATAKEAADAERLYEEELTAELELRRARKAYEADGADKKVLAVELEIAKRRLEWRRRLRRAAGLIARPAAPEE